MVVNDIVADTGRDMVERIQRVMRENGGGAIVNMSSVTSGLTAAPRSGLYGASKGGVDALTKVTAVKVAKENIRVNSLAFIGADVEKRNVQRFLAEMGIPEQRFSPNCRRADSSKRGSFARLFAI